MGMTWGGTIENAGIVYQFFSPKNGTKVAAMGGALEAFQRGTPDQQVDAVGDVVRATGTHFICEKMGLDSWLGQLGAMAVSHVASLYIEDLAEEYLLVDPEATTDSPEGLAAQGNAKVKAMENAKAVAASMSVGGIAAYEVGREPTHNKSQKQKNEYAETMKELREERAGYESRLERDRTKGLANAYGHRMAFEQEKDDLTGSVNSQNRQARADEFAAQYNAMDAEAKKTADVETKEYLSQFKAGSMVKVASIYSHIRSSENNIARIDKEAFIEREKFYLKGEFAPFAEQYADREFGEQYDKGELNYVPPAPIAQTQTQGKETPAPESAPAQEKTETLPVEQEAAAAKTPKKETPAPQGNDKPADAGATVVTVATVGGTAAVTSKVEESKPEEKSLAEITVANMGSRMDTALQEAKELEVEKSDSLINVVVETPESVQGSSGLSEEELKKARGKGAALAQNGESLKDTYGEIDFVDQIDTAFGKEVLNAYAEEKGADTEKKKVELFAKMGGDPTKVDTEDEIKALEALGLDPNKISAILGAGEVLNGNLTASIESLDVIGGVPPFAAAVEQVSERQVC